VTIPSPATWPAIIGASNNFSTAQLETRPGSMQRHISSFVPACFDTSAWKKKSSFPRPVPHWAARHFTLHQPFDSTTERSPALLVLTPSLTIINAIRTILAAHNPKEEGPSGIYAQCEKLPGFNSGEILLRFQEAPAVAMAGYVDTPVAIASARSALVRAGYDSGMLDCYD
jgi:hypothetical protein